MGKFKWRRNEVESVALQVAPTGSRAVFLVEARGAGEQQKVRELFEALAELAEVAPLCDGTIMAFAVQLRGDTGAPSTLFGKLELALREEFSFSLVERSFNNVIYHLVSSLCGDSSGTMRTIPRCGICNEPEPFPTRVTFRDASGCGVVEACYCPRCAAQQADASDREFLSRLLKADRRGLDDLPSGNLVEWPAESDGGSPLPIYRIAS